MNQDLTRMIDHRDDCLFLSGSWQWNTISQNDVEKSCALVNKVSSIDITQIQNIDICGAYFITKLINKLCIDNVKSTNKQHEVLKIINNHYVEFDTIEQPTNTYEKVYQIGENTTEYLKETKSLISFIGETALSYLLQIIKTPFSTKWRLLLDIIQQTGVKAVGIVSLLCFLIGIVLCYQVGSQLKQYGANIFVVDLLGISLLREFAPLITAIIIAGRSASSFTAELGSMKVQQEIDALSTFGISPIKRLVLPRIIGMMISLPLLIVIADITSCPGGMLMAKASLGISIYTFIHRFGDSVSFSNYIIGIIKAPIFALIIGFVGCYRGMTVQNNSLSIGRETTKSVVYSIFLIIIADALFSILFSSIGV